MELTVSCFFCYETFELPLETNHGMMEIIWDCNVCCNPNLIKYKFYNNIITDLEVSNGNE
ncbi:MAG: hypothetical protein CMG08_03430 [Candidatus Marinimicrobia bacterium]|nr:hypothetical protein [Candidatus Neomarinimicrobiota bacterium]